MFSILISAFLLLCSTATYKSNQVLIHATLSSMSTCNGKTAYLFAIYGNQLEVVDSVIISNNKFCLKGNLPHNEDLVQILIPDVASYYLLAAQSEQIEINIHPDTRSFFPPVKGSYASEQMQHLAQSYRNYVNKPSQIGQQAFADSVRQALCNQHSALLAVATKLWYIDSQNDIKADSITHLENEIYRNFPNSIHAQSLLPDYKPAVPTQKSVETFNHRAQITGQNLPFPAWKYEPPKTVSNHTKIYQVGDIIADFTLPNTTNQHVALYSIMADYILIDFWASWCKPCCAEIPYLIAAYKQYGSKFKIYSISLDSDSTIWCDAIQKHAMNKFINVRLDKDNGLFDDMIAKFGITAIPHNFLINRTHTIIAIDLRGEALSKKIKELVE